MGLLTCLFLFCYLASAVIACDIKACYYRNDAALRPPPYTVTPEMLSPQHCNIMIYYFAVIENNRLMHSVTSDDDTPWSEGLYKRFVNLKSKYKHLTMLLSVGGWDFGSKLFSHMCSTPETRKIFIDHAIQFLRKRNFDGLDLHWTFPGYRDGSQNDKFTFTLLVQELKASFEQESLNTGKPRLKLTAALAGDVEKYSNSYEIDKISKELDFVSIMTYDYEVPLNTMHPSPIYGESSEDKLNMRYTVEYYLQKGVPKSKMIIGLPMYGRGYAADGRIWKYNTTSYGGIAHSFATGQYSIFGYFEMCPFVESGIKVARQQGVPYLITNDDYWIGYEDIDSVKYKVMFAKRHGLAGVMIWSLDMDDVGKKICKKPTKNLIETVIETCNIEVPISSYDPPLPTEGPKFLWPYTHPYPIWRKPKNAVILTDEELNKLCKDKKDSSILPYPHVDCVAYIRCEMGFGYFESCDYLMAFDPKVNNCNWHVFVPKCRYYST